MTKLLVTLYFLRRSARSGEQFSSTAELKTTSTPTRNGRTPNRWLERSRLFRESADPNLPQPTSTNIRIFPESRTRERP